MPNASDERAVADVVGTTLLVALTISVAAGLSAVVLAGFPGPTPPAGFSLAASLDAACPWGDGDETVVVEHLGGEALANALFAMMVTDAAGTTRHAASTLTESGDGDGQLEIGESWSLGGRTVDAGDTIIVDIVVLSGEKQVVHTGAAVASADACGGGP